MSDYANFTITIQTWEDDGETQGPRAVIGIDTSRGDPMITQFYYESDRRGIDVSRPFRTIDFDQLASLMPKGASVYEVEAAKQILQTAVERAPYAAPEEPAEGEEMPGLLQQRERSRRDAATIAQDIRKNIEAGVYRAGKPLPTRAVLIRQYPDMTAHSLKIAIQTLQEEGWLGPGTSSGTRVLGDPRKAARKAVAVPGTRGPAAGAGTRLGATVHPSPDQTELLGKLAELGSISAVAEHYGVAYHSAHGWIKRAKRDHLASLPVVDPAES